MTSRKKNRQLAAALPTELSKKPVLVKLNNLNYDQSIFQTMKTDTVVDDFWSNKGGVPRACNIILIGDPGVGKTTVALDIVCDMKANNQRALFISAEMNEIDMYEYMERFPKFGNIDILFLGDHSDENPKLVIENVLAKGYDIVLGDSFVEIIDEIQESCFMSSKASEKWLIDLMCSHNKGNNDTKAYTTFIMIQQMTKGGKFVGSNKLKHNTTGMLEVRFDGNSDMAPRYMEFSKNRRGSVGKKLYFNFDKPEHVNYLEDKWHMEEENRNRMENELDALAKEAEEFDALLNGVDVEESPSEDEQSVMNIINAEV
jgi:predicted ATP-dependent serine protease